MLSDSDDVLRIECGRVGQDLEIVLGPDEHSRPGILDEIVEQASSRLRVKRDVDRLGRVVALHEEVQAINHATGGRLAPYGPLLHLAWQGPRPECLVGNWRTARSARRDIDLDRPPGRTVESFCLPCTPTAAAHAMLR